MNYLITPLFTLLLVVVSVNAKGTTRDKTSVLITQAETAERTKGIYNDLMHLEQEMAAKAGRQGLSPQGQANQARSEAHIQAAIDQMRKYGQQETPPTTTEQESRNIVKAETEIGILAKNALEHAGETPTAPPPIQSNFDTSALVDMQKEASAIKKAEANPVTALPEMTTVKRQQHEHDARKQYDALKAEDAYMTDMMQAGDVNSRSLRMRPRAFFPPTAPRSAGPVPDPVDPYAPKQITVGMNVADLAQAGSGPVVQSQSTEEAMNSIPKRRSNIPSQFQSYDTIPLSLRAKSTQSKNTHPHLQTLPHPQPRVSGPSTHAVRQTQKQQHSQQLRTHTPASNPRQEYIHKYAPLRKGVTDSHSVQTALQNMNKHSHIQPIQIEETNTEKIVETLNKAADTVKALSQRDENTVEINPITISVDSQRIAEKVDKVNKEFDELIRESQVSSLTMKNNPIPFTMKNNNEDSLLIKNTERNVKEAKEALKKLIEQQQKQPMETKKTSMTEQNDNLTPINVSEDTKEIVTKEPRFESWLDRAKRLTTKFIPKFDTVYTDGTTVPEVPKVSDYAATGDDDELAAKNDEANANSNENENANGNENANTDPNANSELANVEEVPEGGENAQQDEQQLQQTEQQNDTQNDSQSSSLSSPSSSTTASTSTSSTTPEEEDEGLDSGEVTLKKGTVNKQLIKTGLEKLRKENNQLNANTRLLQSKNKLLSLTARIKDDTKQELEMEKKAKEGMKALADKHQNEAANAVRSKTPQQSIMSADNATASTENYDDTQYTENTENTENTETYETYETTETTETEATEQDYDEADG